MNRQMFVRLQIAPLMQSWVHGTADHAKRVVMPDDVALPMFSDLVYGTWSRGEWTRSLPTQPTTPSKNRGGATICGSHEPIGIRSLFYSVGSLGISVSLLAEHHTTVPNQLVTGHWPDWSHFS